MITWTWVPQHGFTRAHWLGKDQRGVDRWVIFRPGRSAFALTPCGQNRPVSYSSLAEAKRAADVEEQAK